MQVKVIHGDAIEVMKQWPDETIRAVITSPPYNLRTKRRGNVKAKNGWAGKWKTKPDSLLSTGFDMHSDDMPHDQYVEWQRECLKEMMRLLRSDGVIFYNHKWRVQNGLMQGRSDIMHGFPVRQIIIWEKAGGINFNESYFLPNYEVIYIIAKPDFKLLPKANAIGCVWRIKQDAGIAHPAPFPVELAMRCIRSISKGLILDPFFGSGSTGVAAKRLGYPCIGIDKSKKYVDMARKRIAREVSKMGNLFGI